MILYRVANWDSLYETHRTRDLKKLDWVPVPNKTDGDGYTELLDHPSGAAHLGAWLAILQLASKASERGVLRRESGADPAHTPRSMARISRIPARVFEEAIPRLLAIGWLTAETIDNPNSCIEIAESRADPALSRADLAVFRDDPAKNRAEGKGREGNIYSSPASAAEGVFDLEPPKPEPSKESFSRLQSTWFEKEFWPIYWRKVDKADGLKAFRKHATSEALKNKIVAAVKNQSAYYMGRDEEHRPHAATWLSKRRYEDGGGGALVVMPKQVTSTGSDEIGFYQPEWLTGGAESGIKR